MNIRTRRLHYRFVLLQSTLVAFVLGLIVPFAAQASHDFRTFENTLLGRNGAASWSVMDALPTGDGDITPRRVHLRFDLLLREQGPDAERLRIDANGMTVLDTSFALTGLQAYPGTIGEELFPAGTGECSFRWFALSV